MKKKTLYILMSTLIAASLTACGNKDLEPTIDSQNTLSLENNNVDDSKENVNTDNNEEEDKDDEAQKEDEVSENNDTSVSNNSGRIYYHEGFSGNNYYLSKEIKGNDKTKVSQIIDSLKALPGTDYLEDVQYQEFTPLNSEVSVNDVVMDGDTIKIDLSKNFTEGLGSSEENSLVESIVNSIGYNLNVNKVIITFNGENYSSGHTYMEDGEAFEVKNNNSIELNYGYR